MDGLILVHKPKNITSHDVVVKIRKILNIKKVGHFGSLDPNCYWCLSSCGRKSNKIFPFLCKERF